MDDAGRIVDICEIGDDSYGYAYLSALLAERATGSYSVAIATDSEDRLVPRLLTAAGWALAVVDRRSADELADRFGNDGATDGDSQRRALGLARAVQAGALLASQRPVPVELSELQPLLAAHGALATGRHATATALREVLRELYPAALRAYPDPADPVALAVMDALPDPGALTGRGTDAIAARLAATGLADQAAIAEAVNALRQAVTETSRRGGATAALGITVAETVRQAVAAVRACDAATTALVGALVNRASATSAAATRTATTRIGSDGFGSRHAAPDAGSGRLVRDRSASLEREDAGLGAGVSHRWRAEPPDLAEPIPVRGGTAPAPVAPHNRPVSPPPPPPPGITPIPPRQPTRAGSGDQAVRVPVPRPTPDRPPLGSRADWPTSTPPDDDWATTPHQPPRADALHNGALPSRQAPTERSDSGGVTPPWRADDLRQPEPPPLHLGPLPPDDFGLQEPPLPVTGSGRLGGSATHRRSPEPPDLAGIPELPAELRGDYGISNGAPRSAPPVAADDDDTLLIFRETRSAWFEHDPTATWNSAMDLGWQAAEQAARPTVGDRTGAGLPRRVPHANLVPGAPPRTEHRPLRVVRDPASIAAHTSGYFNGWRRGQQVGGYPLGSRNGPQAGAWEFDRDENRMLG